MSDRKKDVLLTDGFTPTTHSHPTAPLDPATNKVPNDLNVLVINASRAIVSGIAYAEVEAVAVNLILAACASSSQGLALIAREARDVAQSAPITSLAVDITSSESVRVSREM